jgi:hypothetical protein
MSFQEIDDSNLPCVAASIGAVIVPESLTILECCQDPDNLNIIYIQLSVSGIFDYTPTVTAEVDGNITGITSFFIPSYKGIGLSSFPITTNCGSRNVLIAFNAGSAITSFASVPSVTINIVLNGVANLSSLSNFINNSGILTSSNPTASFVLNKGITPTPYRIYFDRNSNQLKIQYTSIGSNACLCAINCVNPTEDDFSLTVCNNEIQEISVDNNQIFGDPTNLTISFQDNIGNISNLSIHTVINAVPAPVGLNLLADSVGIQVLVYFVSINGVLIDSSKVSYQILRYENNPDNIKILFDWTDKDWKVLIDKDIRTGRKYGYSVRFKGEFGEISELSAWSVINI